MIISTCHPERSSYAKGLCRACYLREWQAANPDRVRAYGAAWAARHPDKVAASKARRAALLASTHDERMTAKRERATARVAAELADRFWAKVDRSGECWTWTASAHSFGYGRFGIGRRVFTAHRVAWELVNGPVPGGLHVCHRCDNPPCVRPDHLFLGTAKENLRDMIAKGRGGGQYQPGHRPTRWDKAS